MCIVTRMQGIRQFSRCSSKGNLINHIRVGIYHASSHFVCSESFNFMASARQQPDGRIRKPSVWNDIAYISYNIRISSYTSFCVSYTSSIVNHDIKYRFVILLFEKGSERVWKLCTVYIKICSVFKLVTFINVILVAHLFVVALKKDWNTKNWWMIWEILYHQFIIFSVI
jgi:hypothetical protein